MGLWRAGFDVVGIDNRKQPRYPFQFIRGDALRPPVRLGDFGLVWASPPCQRFTTAARAVRRGEHPDLIPQTRAMLDGMAYVIENVPQAPIRPDIKLTGAMFGATTYRERWFECSFFVPHPPRGRRFGPMTRDDAVTVTGHPWKTKQEWRRHPRSDRLYRGRSGTKQEWAEALGIDWMHHLELAQAIPPAYSKHIGYYAMMALSLDPDEMHRDSVATPAAPHEAAAE